MIAPGNVGRETPPGWGSRSEKGAALVIALLIMGVLLLLGTAFLTISSTETQIAFNQRDSVQALYNAEAGIERAKSYLDGLNASGLSFNSTLNQWPFGQNPDPVNRISVQMGALSVEGNYLVQITDNIDDNPSNPSNDVDKKVIATSTGIFGRAQRLIVATIGTRTPVGVITGGNLTISGNAEIGGSGANIHSNGNITISGNPEVEKNVTTSGTCDCEDAEIGGTVKQGVAPRPLPVINAADYRPSADYELRADGNVYAGQSGAAGPPGTFLANATTTPYNGWRWTESKWDYQGNTAYSGSYYAEGNVEVGSNPGKSGLELSIPLPPLPLPSVPLGANTEPWKVSIFATGDIVISGNPKMVPKDNRGYLLIAGKDIKISGNPEIPYPGIIAAHEQIRISGNLEGQGFVLGEDGAATSSTVTSNVISGNPEITYNGFPSWPWSGGITILAWQEVQE